MRNKQNHLHFLHFHTLDSTNQKLYQLAVEGIDAWTVVSCDKQFAGKGYGENKWKSDVYKNAIFSFVLKDTFHVTQDLPYLNMWIAVNIVEFLSNWQIECKVKWPNDIILHNKKLSGILIENKIKGTHTKFVVVGIGLNILQTDFDNLTNATSLQKEFPKRHFVVKDFIENFMQFLLTKYDEIANRDFQKIQKKYNSFLFKKNQVAVYLYKNQKYNGIMQQVDENGNALITLENLGTKTFKHKEIKLLY